MSESIMNYAVVGTGAIAQMFVQTASRMSNLHPYAVCSRTEARGQEFAMRNGFSCWYSDYQKLIEDDQVDLVYIATPNALHALYIEAAIEADKHIICEKPLVSNTKEFLRIFAKAIERRTFLFEAITTLYLPNYQKVRPCLPALGEIRLVNLDYSRTSSRYRDFKHGRIANVFSTNCSGGSLMDMGVYCVHVAVDLFGEPSEVQYFANLADTGVDTSGVLILRYPTMIASLHCGKDSESVNLNQIQGEEGYIFIEGGLWTCPKVTLMQAGKYSNLSVPQREHMYYELETFVDVIRRRDFDFVRCQLEHSGQVLRVLDKARKSASIQFPADT